MSVQYLKVIKLKKLTQKQKSAILSNLYSLKDGTRPKIKLELDLRHEGEEINKVDVILNNSSAGIDCKISHFGYNFYFRTLKGVNRQKYGTLGGLVSSLKKICKHYGYNIIHIRLMDNNCYPWDKQHFHVVLN
jgi:hypothetical protein